MRKDWKSLKIWNKQKLSAGGYIVDKKEFLKRMGQIYALAIQKGYSVDEIMKYTEMSYSFLYLSEESKQKSKISTK
jgi:hypothetical protein